jgi:hypothetical protein
VEIGVVFGTRFTETTYLHLENGKLFYEQIFNYISQQYLPCKVPLCTIWARCQELWHKYGDDLGHLALKLWMFVHDSLLCEQYFYMPCSKLVFILRTSTHKKNLWKDYIFNFFFNFHIFLKNKVNMADITIHNSSLWRLLLYLKFFVNF